MGDTTPEAARIQLDVQRRLTGQQRMQIAFEMSKLARELCLTRLRLQHPVWSAEELHLELLRSAFAPGPLPPFLQ